MKHVLKFMMLCLRKITVVITK